MAVSFIYHTYYKPIQQFNNRYSFILALICQARSSRLIFTVVLQ